MASTRDIRRRIRSIGSTSQITRAMQMVAASKMRKAQEAALRGRPFVQLLYSIQRAITTHLGEFSDPLLEVREVRKRAVILVGADKGLCGALNSNLFRLATQFDPKTTVFITAGKKAAQFVAVTGRQLIADFPYHDTPRFEEARAIAKFGRDLFLKKEVDEVLVLATRFVNTLTQHPLELQFLPIGEVKDLTIPTAETADAHSADANETLFEPSVEEVLEYFLPRYLGIFIYQVLLNAKASEQSARMVSMQNATENAESLIKDLTLEYNKIRQGSITQELLEIAGGQAG
jgi:F-type H+-transporting ATPase subunit gamma